MYFVGQVELSEWKPLVGMQVVADIFSIVFIDVFLIFEEPGLDGVRYLQGVGVCVLFGEALLCGGIIEVEEAVMDVLVVGDGTWAKAFIGVWEEEVVIVDEGAEE